MGEAAGRIALYHNLFITCLAVAFLCLMLAAVLFFALDIKAVLGYLTGWQRRKKIKEIAAANAVSGRLMRGRSSMRYAVREGKESRVTEVLEIDGKKGAFRVERELILIHTKEVIE